jgi:ABC-type multidrug transport system ATPase subunit
MTVKAGEIMELIGQNGAGKTTTPHDFGFHQG